VKRFDRSYRTARLDARSFAVAGQMAIMARSAVFNLLNWYERKCCNQLAPSHDRRQPTPSICRQVRGVGLGIIGPKGKLSRRWSRRCARCD
jgi:hypothetical protein